MSLKKAYSLICRVEIVSPNMDKRTTGVLWKSIFETNMTETNKSLH